ncbi:MULTISPECIES: NUDIX domain-containing protein [Mycolicibacterium]|uniref:NUDIX domain-containing protein n=1 Tax=Mycolicibacterium TaxID=1866885 RepID=UPI002615B1BD|nr:NUDIX domain-containing protein [Mycolicibacterium fortuitum]
MTSLKESNLFYPNDQQPAHGTWLSVDVLALTDDHPETRIALIRRDGTPHRGAITLPGGLLAAWNGETVEQAAHRIVSEKVGIEPISEVAVLDVVSDPLRDERGHTVSIVVAVRVPSSEHTAGTVTAADIPDDMPFGHTAMARTALARLGERLLTDPSTTYPLLGAETNFNEVYALLRACSDITDTAARARLERSALYRKTSRQHRSTKVGRPARVYERTT